MRSMGTIYFQEALNERQRVGGSFFDLEATKTMRSFLETIRKEGNLTLGQQLTWDSINYLWHPDAVK